MGRIGKVPLIGGIGNLWRGLSAVRGEMFRFNYGDTATPTLLDFIKAAAVGGGRQDTFTATGNGVTLDRAGYPGARFALQVTGTLTQVGTTVWTVILEGSLDGVTFTTILTHTYPATADGATVWQSAGVQTPCRYMRTRCSALTLGTATNIISNILVLP